MFCPTSRLSYTQVCGRINGYLSNSPNAFNSSVTGNINLDSWYVDGVSLTHGPPGSRTHVWHLQMCGMKLLHFFTGNVPACFQTILSGHILCHSLLEINTSVLLE